MNWLYMFSPLVAVFSTQLFVNLKSAGDIVKFRPPPWAFGIIWTILLLMFGYSWVLADGSKTSSWSYPLTTILLAMWVIVYGKSPKFASWLLILVTSSILACFTTGNQQSKVLLCPLLSWCIFATIMNTTEVQS